MFRTTISSLALLRRAVMFLTTAAAGVVGLSLPAFADIFGRWQTFSGLGYTYTFDVQVQSGSPGGTRTISGEVTPTNTLDEDCRRVSDVDRLRTYICERLSKDGPFPLAANLNMARGQTVLTGTDRNSGATLRLTTQPGANGPVARLSLTLERADGSIEELVLAARKRDVRTAPQTLAGDWIAEAGGLTLEARIGVVDESRVSIGLSAFADRALPVPGGPPLDEWHRLAATDRPFTMHARAGRLGQQPQAFYGTVLTQEGDFPQRIGAGAEIKPMPSGTLQFVFTGAGVGGVLPEFVTFARADRPLRPVTSGAGDLSPAEASAAGTWIWSSGENRTGNVILLELAGGEPDRLSGSIHVWNTDGRCEAFQRTQTICELGRDHGPFGNRIALAATGDDRWPFDALEGLRAYGKDFPAFSDLRMRLRRAENGTLLVQMTAADAFGSQPDNTYVFERIDRAAAGAPDAPERRYVAKPGDPAQGACEAWAKDDSLLRQKNLPAVTANLDAILADQKIGVSGHPLDRQCKQMLDDMAEAGLDPSHEDGGPDRQSPQPPAAAEPVVGTWRMVGQPHEAIPAQGKWQPATAYRAILTGFEISEKGGVYNAEERNGPFSTIMDSSSISPEVFRAFLDKAIPGTGAASLMEWIGTPQTFLLGGNGRSLGWLHQDMGWANEVGLLVAGDRALLLTDGPNGFTGRDGMLGLITEGRIPRNLAVAAFERDGASADPVQGPVQGGSTGSDVAGAALRGGQRQESVEGGDACEALERRVAALNAVAGPATVQLIRSIYADAGLAFAGEQTEAGCRKALDGVNAIVLVPDAR